MAYFADGRAGRAELRLGGRRHRGARRGDPRVRRAAAAQPRQLLGDLVRTLLYILLPLAFVGALVLVSQGVIQTSRLRDLHTCWAATRPSPLARPPRRTPSSSSARTVAASSTSTRRCRSRTRRLLELRRDAVHPADPGGAHRDLRAHGRQPPPGLGALRRHASCRRRRRGRLHRRAAARRHCSPHRAATASRHDRRQPPGQGAALRYRRHRAVGDCDDRCLQRLGQRRARVAHRSAAACRSPTS